MSTEALQALAAAIEENTKEVRALRAEILRNQLDDDRLYSREELSLILGRSIRSIQRLERQGLIQPGKVGRSTRYSLGSVRDIVRNIARGKLKA